MTGLTFDPAFVRAVLLWCVPLLYLVAAVAGGFASSVRTAWRWAHFGAALAAASALVSICWVALAGSVVVSVTGAVPGLDISVPGLDVRADTVGATVLLLVAFVGWIIVRYSRTYLGGQAGQLRYVRCLMGTLAAVAAVVVTNNLAVLALAWIAASLALHGLLTFYGDRQAALIAAHKKFLVSRVADVCLIAAVVLIRVGLGTLDIDEAMRRAQALTEFSASLQIAAVLIAITALLKCAQLPVHGWLIQVMEAPTPVSALLHAGVVNLGGFVLIRTSPLIDGVVGAQAALVVVGSATAVVAALVMMTRVSIKVMLAWSTCAQMGFMLMQCGLGVYELALLHLVAHSLYKAHAFLAAGGAVEQARIQQLSPRPAATTVGATLFAAAAGIVAVIAAALLWPVPADELPALSALALVVCLALTPLLTSPGERRPSPPLVLGAFGVVFAYFALHELFGRWIDVPSREATVPELIAVMLVCFAALFAVQALIRARPDGVVSQRLYPWFYAGLFLDELVTRSTFRLWPARLSRHHDGVGAVSIVGVRS